MSVVWNRFNPFKLVQSEQKLMLYSGIHVSSHKAHISDGNYIYYLKAGSEADPPLVLLHGYCAGSAVFYKIVGYLAEYFSVYCIDLLGMGRSSRPDAAFTTREQAEVFFSQSIDEFRMAVGLEDFYMAGHSFGGYICGAYIIKHPEQIRAVCFISPAGMSAEPEKLPDFEGKNDNFLVRFARRTVNFLWKANITPTDFIRYAGPLSARLMRVYTTSKFNALPPYEVEALETYLEQINLARGCGEYALSVLLEPGAWSLEPMWQRLLHLDMPMCFLYGDDDWVPSLGAHELAKLYQGILSISYINQSSHQIHFDNPEELACKMLSFFADVDEGIALRFNEEDDEAVLY
jgi:pimeloyl-ACP methyl ester carboxylesterase